MRLSLEHLSGARQGEVDTLTGLPATIGSGPEARIFVPGIAVVHAEIRSDGHRVVLRDGGSGQGTLVAGTEVQEIPLHDGDILELGSGGPRLRCHLSLGGGFSSTRTSRSCSDWCCWRARDLVVGSSG